MNPNTDVLRPARALAKAFLLLVLAGFTASCGSSEVVEGIGDNEGDRQLAVPDELVDKQGLHVLPWVDFIGIPDDASSGVDLDQPDSLELSGRAADLASDARRGDVVFGQANGGFARQIVSVERMSGVATFETRPLNLANVVYGQWDEQYPIGGEGLGTGEAVARQPLGYERTFTGGPAELTTTATIGVDVSPVLEFSGYVKVRGGPISTERGNSNCSKALVDREYACAFGNCLGELRVCVDNLRAALDMTLNPSIAAELSASASYTRDGDKTLGERAFGGVPIGSTPFTISPQVSLIGSYSLSASASGTLSVSASGTAGGPAGFEYRNGSFAPLDPISDGSVSISVDGSAEVEASASVEFGLGARLEFGLSLTGLSNRVRFGSVAGGVDVTAQASFTPLETDQCLSASVNVVPYLEANADLEVDASPLFSFSQEIGSQRQDVGATEVAAWNGGGDYCPVNLIGGGGSGSGTCPTDPTTGKSPVQDTCADYFFEHCYAPSGSCNITTYPDSSVEVEYGSGNRANSYFESETLTDESFQQIRSDALYDDDGSVCGDGERTINISTTAGGGAECRTLVEYTLRQDQLEPPEGSQFMYEEGDVLTVCISPDGMMDVDCAGKDSFEYDAGGSDSDGGELDGAVSPSCLFSSGVDSECTYERAETNSY